MDPRTWYRGNFSSTAGSEKMMITSSLLRYHASSDQKLNLKTSCPFVNNAYLTLDHAAAAWLKCCVIITESRDLVSVQSVFNISGSVPIATTNAMLLATKLVLNLTSVATFLCQLIPRVCTA